MAKAMPASGPATARAKALELLARREHSCGELRVKLRRRGFASDEVAAAVDDLAQQELQSDERFLEAFVAGRAARGQGPVKIAAELRARGLSGTSVTTTLDPHAQQWRDLACTVRERRFGGESPVDAKARATQMRFLAQRGFTNEQTRAALSITKE